MKIGIYGGTFDPIHYGHLLLAETARQQIGLDEVHFVPAGRPPHKYFWNLADASHRVRMLELATIANPYFHVDRFEIDSTETSYTIHTVEHFRERFPAAELFLLLGEDVLQDFIHWFKPREICRKVMPVVIGRMGVEQEDLEVLEAVMPASKVAKAKKHRVPMLPVGYSSSAIRELIAAGKSVRYQTPVCVIEYIEKHGLYRGE